MQIPAINSSGDPLLIGYLTAVEVDEAVLGGYLLVNAAARPLEFHCTAPVRASRAQEILYGPTLRPYLYGEQIGGTLLAKSKLRPSLVLTDCEPMLAVRGASDVTIACLLDEPRRPSGSSAEDDPRAVRFGADVVLLPRGHAADAASVTEQWRRLDPEFDVREPFGRIHEAIDEAQKSRKAA